MHNSRDKKSREKRHHSHRRRSRSRSISKSHKNHHRAEYKVYKNLMLGKKIIIRSISIKRDRTLHHNRYQKASRKRKKKASEIGERK